MSFSTVAKAAAFAPETEEVFLVLLDIDYGTPPIIRVVNNLTDITSNGNVYTAFPFDIVLPDDTDDKDYVARLTIDNVSREITQSLRQISEPPTITISVIRAADPDTIELALPNFTMRNVSWDELSITADLSVESLISEPYPHILFEPVRFPALF